jgi:hypothetical protein
MTSTAADLITAVTARAAGTPYEVVPTAEGLDLRIRLADAHWHGPLGAGGRRVVVQHRVRLDESTHRLTIVDDHYDLTWSAGLPVLTASARTEQFQGRTIRRSSEKIWGPDGQQVVDYSFSSDDGHRIIREPARALGWKERMGGVQLAGIIVAGSVGGILATAGIVVAALVASGRL